MHDFIRKPKNIFSLIIVLSFLFALIYSFVSATKTNFPSYNASNKSNKKTVEEEPVIETKTYTDDTIGLSMSVPTDWVQVIRGGHVTFVNQTDAAALQFIISDYQPTLNSITQETVSTDVENSGGTFGGYAQYDATSYLAIYELNSVDYFEYTSWDLDTYVRVSLQVPSARYQYYYDIAVYLFDTFSWNKPNPIPDGMSLFYSSTGNFEFGTPTDWTAKIANGAYTATSPDTGAFITCSVTENTTGLSSLSQIDYVNTMSQSKSQYMLTSYSNAGNTLSAEANYSNNGETWNYIHYLYWSATYLYEFSLDCPQSSYDTDDALFLTAITLFRRF